MVDHNYDGAKDPGDGGAAAILASLCVAALVIVGVIFYVSLNSDSNYVVAFETVSPVTTTAR